MDGVKTELAAAGGRTEARNRDLALPSGFRHGGSGAGTMGLAAGGQVAVCPRTSSLDGRVWSYDCIPTGSSAVEPVVLPIGIVGGTALALAVTQTQLRDS